MSEKMTEAQIEVAARTLCRLRGIDPEAMVGHGAEPDANGFVPAVWLYSPAWRVAARDIIAAEQVALAIEAGRDAWEKE